MKDNPLLPQYSFHKAVFYLYGQIWVIQGSIPDKANLQKSIWYLKNRKNGSTVG